MLKFMETPIRKYHTIADEVMKRLSSDYDHFWPLQVLSEWMSLGLGQLVFLIYVSTLVFALVGVLPMTFTVLPTVLYPVWASFSSMHSRDDQLIWCFFWMVVVLVVSLESSCGWLLQNSMVYQPVRTLFFIWMGNPKAKGHKKVYKAIKKVFGL